MRRFMIAGALAIAACGLGGMAHAQPQPQLDPDGEEYCVYMKLTETSDYAVVAEALLAGLDQDKAQAAVKVAGDACIKEFDMSQNQAALASDVGIFGAAADYLVENLMDAGLNDDVIDAIYMVIDEMSDEDLDMVFDGSWRDDAVMKARLQAAVIAKGVPDEDGLVQDACLLIEVSALGVDAAMNYLMADMADFDEEES